MAKFNREFYDSWGRVCTECKEYKPYAFFHKHKNCVNGFNVVCKECRKPLSKLQYKSKPLEYHIWHRAKTRAVEKGLPFNLEISDIIIPKECPIFKTKFEVSNHKTCASIDRIIPELGYVKGNIQIISNKANMIKGDASLEELRALLNWLEKCEIN